MSAVRHNKYLRKLAAFVCPRRQRSSARFITDLAAVTSIITTVACDILFLTFSNRSLQEVQRRHGPALQALELLYQLVDNPSVLAELGYSAEQTTTAVDFFGMFIGAQGLQPHPPDDWRLRDEAAALRGPRDEAPFTVQLMFLLLSRQLSLLALAECITRARFGFWSEDRRSFYPDPLPQAVFGVRWGMVTASVRELGRVVVSFTGAFIDAVRFEEAWPAARFRAGRHFMDACFQLPFAEGSTTVFQTTAAYPSSQSFRKKKSPFLSQQSCGAGDPYQNSDRVVRLGSAGIRVPVAPPAAVHTRMRSSRQEFRSLV